MLVYSSWSFFSSLNDRPVRSHTLFPRQYPRRASAHYLRFCNQLRSPIWSREGKGKLVDVIAAESLLDDSSTSGTHLPPSSLSKHIKPGRRLILRTQFSLRMLGEESAGSLLTAGASLDLVALLDRSPNELGAGRIMATHALIIGRAAFDNLLAGSVHDLSEERGRD